MEKNFILKETLKYSLSFAVALQDDFSKQGFLVGKTRVFLKGKGRDAFKNPSGYYIFLDLTEDSFVVKIENKGYFDKEIEVIVEDLNPKHPVVNTTMIPNYLYPFPTGSTLIRGKVLDNQGIPIPYASIQLVDSNITNHSETDGRFVLYFGPLTEDDIKIGDNHRYVVIREETNFMLKVEHPDYKTKIVEIDKIEEGKTKLLAEPVLLDLK